MTKDEMDTAIDATRAKLGVGSYKRLGSLTVQRYRAAFIAGMRAGAELPGNPNALQRDTIRVAANRLEKTQ